MGSRVYAYKKTPTTPAVLPRKRPSYINGRYGNISGGPTSRFQEKMGTGTVDAEAGADDKSGNNRSAVDYANLALGVRGVIGGLKSKRPELEKPKHTAATIRPAQGDQTFVDSSKKSIAEQTAGAAKDIARKAGSSVSDYMRGRLALNDQGLKAVSGVHAQNSKIYRGDQNRVEQAQNTDKARGDASANEFNLREYFVDTDNFNKEQASL
jgi:hypothetical protein